MKKTINSAAIGAAAAAVLTPVAVTGCSAGTATPAPTVTVTHTRTVIEQKTQPAAKPAPAVTKTVSATASEPASGGASPGGSVSPSPGANQIIVRFSGSGTQNTASFATPDNWHLSWAYWGCPSGTSNFQVTEYNTDGSVDPNGISVNELGTGRGPVATYAYGDAGTHYLSINTEGCNWSLVPVTG